MLSEIMNFQNKLAEFTNVDDLKLWLSDNEYVYHENKYFMRISTKCNDMTNPLVRCSYSVLIDKENFRVLSSLPWLENVDKDRLSDYMVGNYEVQECVDGTQIRVFWHNDSWKVATKNHPDANRATWSSPKSYYRLFKEASKYLDYDKLDQTCSYVFALCHPEDMKVACHNIPKLYHLSTFDTKSMEFIDQDIGVYCPKRLELSYENLLEFLSNVRSTQCAGIVVRTDMYPNVVFKVESDKYKYGKELMGNCNNFGERMLELILEDRVHEFTNVFRDLNFIKKEILRRLSEVKETIYMLYMDYYVNNKVSFVPFCYHNMLVSLNTMYLNTREKITRKSVMEELKKMSVDKLMLLLNV
jgi:hypothetical protein